MRAITVPILFQRGDDVLGVLTFELRDAVVRIGILIAIDPMAPQAGVGDLLALLGITSQRLLGRH